MKTRLHRLIVKFLGRGRCLKEDLLHVTCNPALAPQYKKNMNFYCGKVHSSNYMTAGIIVFSLNPNT